LVAFPSAVHNVHAHRLVRASSLGWPFFLSLWYFASSPHWDLKCALFLDI